jgi:hypothetical protein
MDRIWETFPDSSYIHSALFNEQLSTSSERNALLSAECWQENTTFHWIRCGGRALTPFIIQRFFFFFTEFEGTLLTQVEKRHSLCIQIILKLHYKYVTWTVV